MSGGLQLVTAGADGGYVILAVPVGLAKIEALDPSSGQRGDTQVTILSAGQASTGIDVVLAPLGSVTGRVLDGDGAAVPFAGVILVVAKSADSFTIQRGRADGTGFYKFDQLQIKEYPLSARRGRAVGNATAHLTRELPDDIVDVTSSSRSVWSPVAS